MTGELIVFFLVVVVIPIAIAGVIQWFARKKRLGKVRCRRCRHVGSPKGQFRPFRGIIAVCRECEGEDWVKEDR